MKLRFIAMLLAIPALIAAALVSSSAKAASHSTYVTSTSVAVAKPSNGLSVAKVGLRCSTSKGCKGTVYFEGAGQPKTSYSIKGASTISVSVPMIAGSAQDPNGKPVVGDKLYSAVPDVTLIINESTPTNINPLYYTVQTETVLAKGQIQYAVKGPDEGSGRITNRRITVVRMLPGGNMQDITWTDNDSGAFSLPLGSNNAPGEAVALRISAKVDGTTRSWWWRGANGNPAAGGRYPREATLLRATKDGFKADFLYGRISGLAPAGATVKAYAPPSSITTVAAIRRDFDVPSCANAFGEAKNGGNYSITFLPRDDGSDPRYMISTAADSKPTWAGKTGADRFGSCYAITNYAYGTENRGNLINFNGNDTAAAASAAQPPITRPTGIKAHYSGFTPTYSDTWVTVREQVPDLPILETRIVGDPQVVKAGELPTFDLPYGRYYVEIGRRTGCSAWYASVYPNNSAYFSGEDRGAEAWKSFTTLSSLPGSKTSGLEKVAYDHGASYDSSKQGAKPKGYAGWMYRDHCKALGTGSITSIWVTSTSDATRDAATDYKGAVVSGTVKRVGGKTNKEMLVRLSSTDGKRVLRTDVTDSSGKFYVAGLTDGNYLISLNSDSWRGIGRSFSGDHYVRVTHGKTYNVGTLTFKS